MQAFKVNLIFLLLVLVLSWVSTDDEKLEGRIINGRPVNIETHPFTAAIKSEEEELQCTGVIITTKWVLTAAHCYDSDLTDNNEENTFVVVGETWPQKARKRYEIFVVIIHHRYRETHQYFDLALIETDDHMELDGHSAAVARLPRANAPAPPKMKICKFAGFGNVNIPDEDRAGNERLYSTEVVIEDNVACHDYWTGYNMDDHLCGRTSRTVALFSGDSGGPLICDNIVVGMFRAGVDPGNIDFTAPGIFLDLAEFREYIDRTIKS